MFIRGGLCVKILLCDDQSNYLDELRLHVEEYMKNHFIKPEYVVSTSSEEIIASKDIFDLAFLDIQMGDIGGLTVAKELKRRNNKVVIFFVTNYPEFQDDAMDLRVFRFFEKPFDVNRLYSGLDKALEYLDETYIDVYLAQGGTHLKVLVDDIYYIKRENREIIVVTKNGEYKTSKSLEYWNEKLPNTFFYLVHKSFLINLHYVTKYSYTEVFINENTRISIATRKQAEFHKYWFMYLRGK